MGLIQEMALTLAAEKEDIAHEAQILGDRIASMGSNFEDLAGNENFIPDLQRVFIRHRLLSLLEPFGIQEKGGRRKPVNSKFGFELLMSDISTTLSPRLFSYPLNYGVALYGFRTFLTQFDEDTRSNFADFMDPGDVMHSESAKKAEIIAVGSGEFLHWFNDGEYDGLKGIIDGFLPYDGDDLV